MYLAYGVLLICYLIFSGKFLTYIENPKIATFNNWPSIIWSIVLSVVLGLLLGLESFILETRKEGNWKVNWPKVLFLVLPSLYFSIGIFCPIGFVRQACFYLISLFSKASINITSILLIILGYTLITRFIKVKE